MLSLHGRWLLLACLLPALSTAEGKEPPRTDHYGDPLPKSVRFRLGSLRLRHEAAVRRLCWLPDGRTLVSSGSDLSVRLWQIPGGKQLARWDNLEGVVFSPDGRTFVTKTEEGTIRIVDTATGAKLRCFHTPKKLALFPAVISPDGKILAAIEWEKGVHLIALDSGKEVRFLEAEITPLRFNVVFSPDGRTLIVNMESGVYRWPLDSGAKSRILGGNGDHSIVFAIAFAPDGKTLAAVLGDGIHNFVTLRSWPAGKELKQLKAEDYSLETLAFSADGKHLAAGGLGYTRLWDTATGKEIRRFKGLAGEVLQLAFSPDGSLLASAEHDGGITLWEVDAQPVPRPLTGARQRQATVALSADGRTLATEAGDGALILWDGRDGRRLRTVGHCDDRPSLFRLAPDASRLLVLPRTGNTPLWWDVTSGQQKPAFSGILRHGVTCADFSPDSALLALGGFEGIVSLRETAQGRELCQLQEKGEAAVVCKLAFAPDGRTLATSHTDSKLILWDLRTGRPRRRISCPSIKQTWGLQFSADSRLLSALRQDVHLIEAFSGHEIRQVRGNPRNIEACAFAPDNRTLAVSEGENANHRGVSQSTIRLVDLRTGQTIRVLRGHQREVHTLIFSPDGASLVSCSDDRTVLCWDIADVIRRRADHEELSDSQLTVLWTDLASKDASRGQRAVAEWIQAPDAALPFLEKSLPPVATAETNHITALILNLDHAEFVRRDKASRELDKIGASAAPALRKALTEKPSLEMRRRIEALLDAIDSRPLTGEELRTLRAVQVLETIGTPAAQRILEGLAHGAANFLLTQESQAALQRLQRRHTKP